MVLQFSGRASDNEARTSYLHSSEKVLSTRSALGIHISGVGRNSAESVHWNVGDGSIVLKKSAMEPWIHSHRSVLIKVDATSSP